MTALAANRNTPRMISRFDMEHARVGADSKTNYEGAIIMLDPATGKLQPATAATGLFCYGRCKDKVVTGASNTLVVTTETGIFRWTNGESIAATDIGKPAYADDDQTIMKTSTGRSKVGTIYDVDSLGVWVAVVFPAASL